MNLVDESVYEGKPLSGSSERLSLKSNFIWTVVGNVFYAGCQAGMLFIIAKLGTPEMVGRLALALAICAPIIIFSNLKLRNVQATDAKGEYEFGHYLALRIVSTALAMVVIVMIALMPRYRGEIGLIIIAIGIAKGFETLSDIFYGLFQQYEHMDRIAISMMIKGVVSLTVQAIILYFTRSLLYSTLGMAAVWALIFCLYDVSNSIRILNAASDGKPHFISRSNISLIKPIWDRKRMLHLTWQTLPLGLAVMVGSLNTNVPRYFLEYHVGIHDLGIYVAMANLLVASGTIISALGQSASPRMAIYYASNNRSAFYKLLHKLIGIGLVIGVAGVILVVFAGKQILTILYKPEYACEMSVFVLLSIVVGLRYAYVFLGTALSAMRQFHVQFPIHAISLGFLVLLCIFFIPSKGLTGAAWAMMGSVVIEGIAYGGVLIFYIRKEFKITGVGEAL